MLERVDVGDADTDIDGELVLAALELGEALREGLPLPE